MPPLNPVTSISIGIDSFDFERAVAVLRQRHPFRPWISARLDEADRGFARRDPEWMETWDERLEGGGLVLHINAGPKLLKLCLDLAGVAL